MIEKLLNSQSDKVVEMNDEIKEVTLTSENITKISKALTNFSFRNGPIESMDSMFGDDWDKAISNDGGYKELLSYLRIFLNNLRTKQLL